MNCLKCEFWSRSEESDAEYHGERSGTCSSEFWEYGSKPPEKGVAYHDYSGYSAHFLTDEDFGCVHFSERLS